MSLMPPLSSLGARLGAGNAFGPRFLLQRPSRTAGVGPGAGLAVLHQLGVLGKHGITMRRKQECTAV